jgi:acetoacetyl-CoA synthetase
MTDVVRRMERVKEFKGVVSIPRFKELVAVYSVLKATLLRDYKTKAISKNLEFERTAFYKPFIICYSSGTLRAPKCIVHSINEALVSLTKEIILYREMTPESVALQYTTTG